MLLLFVSLTWEFRFGSDHMTMRVYLEQPNCTAYIHHPSLKQVYPVMYNTIHHRILGSLLSPLYSVTVQRLLVSQVGGLSTLSQYHPLLSGYKAGYKYTHRLIY